MINRYRHTDPDTLRWFCNALTATAEDLWRTCSTPWASSSSPHSAADPTITATPTADSGNRTGHRACRGHLASPAHDELTTGRGTRHGHARTGYTLTARVGDGPRNVHVADHPNCLTRRRQPWPHSYLLVVDLRLGRWDDDAGHDARWQADPYRRRAMRAEERKRRGNLSSGSVPLRSVTLKGSGFRRRKRGKVQPSSTPAGHGSATTNGAETHRDMARPNYLPGTRTRSACAITAPSSQHATEGSLAEVSANGERASAAQHVDGAPPTVAHLAGP